MTYFKLGVAIKNWNEYENKWRALYTNIYMYMLQNNQNRNI